MLRRTYCDSGRGKAQKWFTENREKEFQKVDVDERNPTVEGLVEIDVDARDKRRRQPSNVIRACIAATMAEAPGRDTGLSGRGGGSCRFSEARSKIRAERSSRRTVRKRSRG